MAEKVRTINSIESRAGTVAYCFVVVVLMAAFIATLCMNNGETRFVGTRYNKTSHHYVNYEQYADLADALLQGNLYLDLPVADELANLENPYAVGKRVEVASKDVVIYWDHAYYEGKYYSYFGVMPAVLLYAPYEVITGNTLKTPIAVGALGVLAILAVALMLRRFGIYYFKKTCTTAMLIALLLLAFNGINFTYLAFASLFYSVPILASVFFASLGLWFWIGARSKGETADGEKLSWARLCAGSFCMALTLGCRPQFALASLLAFAIFGKFIFSRKWLFSAYGAKSLAIALAPFVVVYALLFAYNYARFGSILDFGASYNLTGFDMTHYRQRKALTLAASICFLFQPINFTNEFPFVGVTDTTFQDLGWLPTEPFFGGFFMLNPLMYSIVLLPFAWKALREKQLLGFSVLSIFSALIIVLVDIRIAGISQRYFTDSGFFFTLAVSAIMLSLQKRWSHNTIVKRICIVVIVLGLLFTMQVDLMTLFSPSRYYPVAQLNPELYDLIRSCIINT